MSDTRLTVYDPRGYSGEAPKPSPCDLNRNGVHVWPISGRRCCCGKRVWK